MNSQFFLPNAVGRIAFPRGLLLLGSRVYGCTSTGGSAGGGTVFSINTDGSDFKVLHGFTGQDGSGPNGLVVSGTTLYGTARSGGSWTNGTIFRISLPAQLTIGATEASLILTWPTNFSALNLQSTTNLVSPFWTSNLPPPVVVNGLNTVTNPVSGTQQFFRLSQ